MVYLSNTVSLAERNAFTAGYPMMVAGNRLREGVVIQPRWDVGSSLATASDNSDPLRPGYLINDGRMDPRTRPDVDARAATTTWRLYTQIAPSQEFDTVVIGNHNLGDLFAALGSLTVDVYIADNAAFSANLLRISRTILDANSGNARIVADDLGVLASTFGRYSNVEFVRVDIIAGTNHTAANAPEIGELVLGRRRQFEYYPARPYNRLPLVSESSDFESQSGETQRSTAKRGQWIQPLRFKLGRVSESYQMTDELRALFRDCRHGSRRIWYIEQENGSVDAYQCLLRQSRLPVQQQGVHEHEVSVLLTEQPPFLEIERGF